MKPLRRINAKEWYKRKADLLLETKEQKLMPFASCKYKLSFLKKNRTAHLLQSQGSPTLPMNFFLNQW